MIDKRISMSKKLGRVHDKARVLYFMIYPHLDREGRIKFEDIEDLKDEIIPKFKNWAFKKIAEALNELADVELLILYPNGKDIAMQFTRFEDFQSGLRKDREAESIVPEPPESSGVYRITLDKSPLSLSLSIRKLKEGRKEEKIYYDFESSTWKNIKEKDMKLWTKAYPVCNINHELLAMADWLESNPEKKKSNYRAFISRWLKKQQNQGGSKKEKKSYQTRQRKRNETSKEFMARTKKALEER